MNYIPHTDSDRRKMLEACGVDSIDELFAAIPANLRAASFAVAPGLSEQEVVELLKIHGAGNTTAGMRGFLGGGYYDHYVPATVDSLSGRAEFFTAYTPYQPEASQGWLQSIFEYQTAICELTGMDVSNASLYDGTTAVVEGVFMAMRVNNRSRVVVDGALNPAARNVLKTYGLRRGLTIVEVPVVAGRERYDALIDNLDDETVALVVQNPDFFGQVHDYTELFKIAARKKIVTVLSVYPVSLGMLKTPGEMGADIAVGEGQCLGNRLGFGGPYLGIIATGRQHARRLPGRIVGETVDLDGKRGFVLTLQAREQHIRREKATSNICSNQAWCALRALIYLSLLGQSGLERLCRLIYDRSEYMKKSLRAMPSVRVAEYPTFNEWVLELPVSASDVARKMIDKGVVAGLPLGNFFPEMENRLLVSVTERNSRADIDMYCCLLKEVL
jgi:glycine dehydrogenase subunit 1